MNMLLFITTVFVWGSTWLAIKFQIGDVDPMISVSYRFGLAALILIAYCRIRGLRLRFGALEHLFMAMQGLFLFSISYWLVYLAEGQLTSALVAVIYSMQVFFNSLNGFLIFKTPVRKRVITGGLLGLTGVSLIFWPEISEFEWTGPEMLGILFSFSSVFIASVGNILSARNQKYRLPVVQTNAFGMAYGALLLLGLSILTNKTFGFTLSVEYIGSLIYLALFGSIVAFGAYLTLLGRVGADKAAYAMLLIPIVALSISTVFEGYTWPLQAIFGLPLVLAGNILVLKNRKTALPPPGRITAADRRRNQEPPTMTFEHLLADRTQRMGANAIREILKVTAKPGMISLAGGIPAPESFPWTLSRDLVEW